MAKRGKKPNKSTGKKRDTKPTRVETFGEVDIDDEIYDCRKSNTCYEWIVKCEAVDDFDDENGMKDAAAQKTRDENVIKLSQLVSMAGKAAKKQKLLSGDADLPLREDIGERRRKHDLQSLGQSEPELLKGDDVQDHDDASDFEDEFYKEVRQSQAAKIAEKTEKFARITTTQSSPEEEANGKQQISYQMETNKGLTRKGKKLTKIPRKKY